MKKFKTVIFNVLACAALSVFIVPAMASVQGLTCKDLKKNLITLLGTLEYPELDQDFSKDYYGFHIPIAKRLVDYPTLEQWGITYPKTVLVIKDKSKLQEKTTQKSVAHSVTNNAIDKLNLTSTSDEGTCNVYINDSIKLTIVITNDV